MQRNVPYGLVRGPAYDWLTRVCVTFVVVCTLGLEASSGLALRDALSGAHLVLDTDVLLELLGDGEPGHESAMHVVKQWPDFGGRLLLADAVLEEVAYHAWISEHDYQEARDRFLKTETDRRRFVRNVFVRAFGYLMEVGHATSRDWPKYIGAFRGAEGHDCSNTLEYLLGNFRFSRLPEGDVTAPPNCDVAEHLRSFVDRDDSRGRAKKIAYDKAKRDARLYAALHRYSEGLAESGATRSSCVLVTSSGRLKGLQATFPSPAETTLSLGEVAYLLTMVPGSAVTLTALRTLLFDQRVLPKNDELDLLILRAIRDSGEYSSPWARRGAVTRKVRGQLVAAAKDRGEPRLRPEEIADQSDEEARTTLSASIAQALRDTGAEPRVEVELAAARSRIIELEKKLREKAQKPPKR